MTSDGPLMPFSCETKSGKYIVVQAPSLEEATKRIVEEYKEEIHLLKEVE